MQDARFRESHANQGPFRDQATAAQCEIGYSCTWKHVRRMTTLPIGGYALFREQFLVWCNAHEVLVGPSKPG
jgi:hypothetical protein